MSALIHHEVIGDTYLPNKEVAASSIDGAHICGCNLEAKLWLKSVATYDGIPPNRPRNPLLGRDLVTEIARLDLVELGASPARLLCLDTGEASNSDESSELGSGEHCEVGRRENLSESLLSTGTDFILAEGPQRCRALEHVPRIPVRTQNMHGSGGIIRTL